MYQLHVVGLLNMCTMHGHAAQPHRVDCAPTLCVGSSSWRSVPWPSTPRGCKDAARALGWYFLPSDAEGRRFLAADNVSLAWVQEEAFLGSLSPSI